MTKEYRPRLLESEHDIVWLEPRASFPFVRERVWPDPKPHLPPPRDLGLRSGTRLVAFAVCDPRRQRTDLTHRRLWFVRDTDFTGRRQDPVEGVDPSSIAAGRPSLYSEPYDDPQSGA